MGIDFENIIKLLESAKWLFFGILMIVIVCSAIIANEMDRIAAIKGHPEKKMVLVLFLFRRRRMDHGGNASRQRRLQKTIEQ
jgi:hypothetical protein